MPREHLPEGLYWITYEENKGGLLVTYPTTDEDLQRYFYEIEFSNLEFLNSLNLNKSIFDKDFLYSDGGMTNTERVFLYNFTKQIIKPNSVLEFSPNLGGSTLTIAKAVENNNVKPLFFETHELDQGFANAAETLLYYHNVDFVDIKVGDVFETLDKEKLKQVDFLFIDSDHGGEFAEKYVAEFFPLLKKGAWIGIHDIRLHPHYITGKTSNMQSYFHMNDLLKTFKLTCEFDVFKHCCRNTLFFMQI